MKPELAKEIVTDQKVMSQVYSETLVELANEDPDVVALDADLMTVVNMKLFKDAHPDRFINCGIAEADMVGIAAGLSAGGKKPFLHSFAPFVTRRAYDQISTSGAYAQLSMCVVGSDAGITAGYNGGTHQSYEDMGLMRGIPGMTVIDPVDNVMMKDLLKQLKDKKGMFYIRLMRTEPETVYAEGSEFEIGKGVVLREGKDVTLFTSGVLVADTLRAAEQLEKQGVSAKVVNLFTWKPIDKELIEACVKETGCVVTVENHNVVNGLRSAVAEVLAERCPAPLEAVGCQDRFGEVGPQEYVQEAMGMVPDEIVKKALEVIKRK